MVSRWSLSDSKSHQVTRTLLSILADLNKAVLWMVSTCSFISKSFSSCINPFVTVPITRITIGITATFMFHSFFQSSSKAQVLILLFTFFQFYSVVSREDKFFYLASSLFFSCLLLGLVIWSRFGDPFVFQNPRGVCAFHFPGQILGCAYTIYS